MMLLGIDVSNWQGVVDWPAVAAAGKAFGFAKASEGCAYTDHFFARNWAGMQAAGLIRGAYHFARPSRCTAEDEAAHFVSVLENAGGVLAGDLVALDLEDTEADPRADLTEWALTWLRLVEDATGCRPLIYSGNWYLEPHIDDLHVLDGYALWLAAYGDVRPRDAQLWQYSDHGVVNGVSGNADLDRFDGTAEELRALGKPEALPLVSPVSPLVPEAAHIAEQRASLDRLWHVAGLLDSLSAHDLADQVRRDTVLLKGALGLNG